jgi:hypothetical protein
MTNKEITSIVSKAQRVKPYAKVHFPYSVEHVERILGITFNDEERSDMQRFFDTAEFFASHRPYDEEDSKKYGKPLYHVIRSMCEEQDFFSIEEAKILHKSIEKTNKFDVQLCNIYHFHFHDDFTISIFADNNRHIYDINFKRIRREINLAKIFGEVIEYVDLKPRRVYKDYDRWWSCKD